MFSNRRSSMGEVREEKPPRPNWLDKVVPASISQKIPEQTTSKNDPKQDYLIGLRGVLAIMSFLWVFLQTFVPAAVAHSANTTDPDGYKIFLRKTLSVLFWNDSMIYSSFIFLSARTICLPFFLDSTKLTLASCVFRRGLRMWFPTAAALIVVFVVFSKTLGTTYLTTFATRTGNTSMHTDIYVLPSSLANFNAIFEVFWISHSFSYQGGSWAFPTQTLWIVSAIFQQSYTVYMTMVIVPYTRKSWRLWGAAVFIITAWWVYSWAWFSITGLLIADAVVNMDLKAKCQAHRLPVMIAAAVMMLAGYFMCFYWVDVRPDLQYAEIGYHTGLYNTGGIYTWNDTTAPLLRADNYLVICGFYLFLESTDFLQMIFRNPVFVFIGKRSFSYFLLQSIIVYTLGIQIALNMTSDGTLNNYSNATGVAFIVSLLVTFAAGELFYWLLDVPSQKVGRFLFTWIRE